MIQMSSSQKQPVISCKTIQGWFGPFMTAFRFFWLLLNSNFGWFCFFNSYIWAVLSFDSWVSLFLSLVPDCILWVSLYPTREQWLVTGLSYMRESFQWGFFWVLYQSILNKKGGKKTCIGHNVHLLVHQKQHVFHVPCNREVHKPNVFTVLFW